jgi:hypothetical protein
MKVYEQINRSYAELLPILVIESQILDQIHRAINFGKLLKSLALY